MKTNHISYGIIPVYKKDNQIYVCCVHNKKSDEWGLPKGTPEINEIPFETAKRELEEETGISDFEILGGKYFSEKYIFNQDCVEHHKQNVYMIGVVKEMKEKTNTIDSKNMKWINIKEADIFFKFDTIKTILTEVYEYLNKFPFVKKHIYLSGGGNEHQSFLIDKSFLDTFKKGGRFLYIPIALRGHKLFSTAHLWMQGILKLHDRTDIIFDVMDSPSEYTSEDLEKFDAIYIGGGNTWSLLQELKESGFSDLLISYIEKGKSVYGGSAGSIILGKRINTHDDENKINSKDIYGFEVLGNYSVTCHFKTEEGERFKKWALDNSSSIICLPEETGLIINDTFVTCVGEKPATLFAEGGNAIKIQPDEIFEI